MPLSYDEFMKKTDNKGFSPEEQSLLSSFGTLLKEAYQSMNAEDKNSKEYKEHTELREALGEMQDNSVLEPVPDEDEEEKKKKWEEDMNRLVGFVNMLRSGRNLSYFSKHPIGGQNMAADNGQQYFSLLKLLNEKLEAKLEIDEQRELFSGVHQHSVIRTEERVEEKKEEKSEPVSEAEALELKAKLRREQEETLKEWSLVGSIDDQDAFQRDLLKTARGLNSKQWKITGGKADDLGELKNAIGEYNIYLMDKNDGKATELDERKYLKAIIDASDKYIKKMRNDDPSHPENNKAENWEPLFKMNKRPFNAAKDILALANDRLKAVEKKARTSAADRDKIKAQAEGAVKQKKGSSRKIGNGIHSSAIGKNKREARANATAPTEKRENVSRNPKSHIEKGKAIISAAHKSVSKGITKKKSELKLEGEKKQKRPIVKGK